MDQTAKDINNGNGGNLQPGDVTGETITPEVVPANDKTELQEELGRTGTVIISGFLASVDYNPDLAGESRVKLYDEMRKGDATVRAALLASKLPILAANWYIKPGQSFQNRQQVIQQHKYALQVHQNLLKQYQSQETNLTGSLPPPPTPPTPPDANAGKDIEKDPITEFVEGQVLENPNFSWTVFLRQALMFEDYGNSLFEKVFEVLPDGKIGWKKLAQRLSGTIYRWAMKDGKTPGITQITPTAGTREIPDWKLIKFINEQEGSNFEGTSFLRAAYSHWYYKTIYYKIDAIATERQGMGYPVITAPPQATKEDKDKARELARNLRANEQAYLDLPPGFKLEFLDTKGGQIKNSKDMIAHHDRQIVKAMLAQFLELGANNSQGSFALSSNQSDLFLVSLNAVAKLIQEEMNKHIKELVKLNFPNVADEDIPTLEYGNIGQVDFEKLSTALFRLAQGGLIKADPELERYIRNAMTLPEAVQLSENDYVDPETVRVDPPDDSDFQVKAPIRYLNAKEIMEDFSVFAKELRETIEAKENA